MKRRTDRLPTLSSIPERAGLHPLSTSSTCTLQVVRGLGEQTAGRCLELRRHVSQDLPLLMGRDGATDQRGAHVCHPVPLMDPNSDSSARR